MSKFIRSYTDQLVGEVLKDMFINYRNRTIQKIGDNKYVVGFKTYLSLEEAKEAINNSYNFLQNSIKP